MRWPSLLLALTLLFAQTTCNPLGCDDTSCDTHTKTTDTDFLQPGQSWTLTDTTCSTCGHAFAQAFWKVQAGQSVAGDVEFTMQANCGSIAGLPHTVTIDPKKGTANNEPDNIKNLCGDNAQETWTAVLLNNSNVEVTVVSIEMTCPNYTPTPSPGRVPLSPSGIKGGD